MVRTAVWRGVYTVAGVMVMCGVALAYGFARMVLDPQSRQQVVHASADPELIASLPVDVHWMALLGAVMYLVAGLVLVYAVQRKRADPDWSPLPSRGSP